MGLVRRGPKWLTDVIAKYPWIEVCIDEDEAAACMGDAGSATHTHMEKARKVMHEDIDDEVLEAIWEQLAMVSEVVAVDMDGAAGGRFLRGSLGWSLHSQETEGHVCIR